MNKIRKAPTEKEMIEQLRRGKVVLPPLSFRILKGGSELALNFRFDALIEPLFLESFALP